MGFGVQICDSGVFQSVFFGLGTLFWVFQSVGYDLQFVISFRFKDSFLKKTWWRQESKENFLSR